MRFRYAFVVIVALAVGGALIASSAQKGPVDELKKIQGAWKFTAQEMGGQPRPADQLKNMTITFTENQWTVRDGDQVIQAGTNKLDATKNPAQVDAAVTEGENKGITMLGIYELKGDTMKVCFDPQGKERPTSFTAKGGQYSATFKRDFSLEMIQAKFKGRAAYDFKTGELTLTYDFRNADQLKDFDLGKGAKAKVANGVLTLGGSEKYTHVVPFKTVRATADVAVYKPLGFYLGTTGDLQLYIHDNWEVSLWLDGEAASRTPLPAGQHGRYIRYGLAVEEKRIAIQVGTVVLGGSVTDKPRGGHVILFGGHNNQALFKNLVIKGEPEPEWIATLSAP
jgi:uncharacterized protein (TIGR03067 family)